MPHSLRISVVTSDAALASHMQLRLHSKGYQVSIVSCTEAVIGLFYSDPPDFLVIDLSSEWECGQGTVSALRSDSFFSTIPIIGIVNTAERDKFDWESCPLDDFLVLPVDFDELFSRISLSLSRLKRIFDNNPLTRLPGNTSIQRAIEAAMGKQLSVCYVDINNFKPYNDAYGFSHGDEVIRMLARIIFNAVHDAGGGFCGHIGGDDFVCIVASGQAEAVSQTIVNYFDQIVLDLFDEKTKRAGYYTGANRKGDIEHIPLLAVSIAIIPMDSPKLKHYAKVAEVAAELKKFAKESVTSRYVIDSRQT